MRLFFSLLFFSLFFSLSCAQDIITADQILTGYDTYQAPQIKNRRFKHADIEPLIQRLEAPFRVKKAGTSIEGRSIYQVTLGNGPTTVLLWSQMHGDEPTATMALMDLFNFFSRSDQYDSFREKILSELTLVFIPMLNPDGAERFERRNALGIDLNRDALRLQAPESQLLKRIRDELDAEWGFNLHDQSRYYSAGQNPKTAAFSFLAPAYNYEKEINEGRGNAMKLIGLLNDALQAHIPGNVGKYNDAFEPRAFGDNIQKWGTNTILIEVGGYEGDREKQYLRKLHFMLLLQAFEAIADKTYAQESIAKYEAIPFNDSNNFFDLLIREAQVQNNGQWYTLDIGFKRYEVDLKGNRNYYFIGEITDIGDLSIFSGYEELDARGLKAYPGKVYPDILPDAAALDRLNPMQLLWRGITTVQMVEVPFSPKYNDYPLQLVRANKLPDQEIKQGERTSLVLKKGGEVRYAVVNGRLFEVAN